MRKREAIRLVACAFLLGTCASLTALPGLFGKSKEKTAASEAAADRKAPLEQWAAHMMGTAKAYAAKGWVAEASYLIEDLSAAGLAGSQKGELDALKAQVQARYRPEAEDSFYNRDTLVPVKDFNGKYGYIDQTGKFVIPSAFAEAGPFSEGLALVRELKTGPQSFIDRAGKKVLEIAPRLEMFFVDQAMKTVWVRTKDKEGFVSYDGSFEIPLSRIEVKAMGGFHSGLARLEVRSYDVSLGSSSYYARGANGTIYIDRTGGIRIFLPDGTWGIDDDYQPRDFSEGRAAVRVKSKGQDLLGYIDTTGKLAIDPAFSYAGDFRDGLAAIMYPNTRKWGFIGLDGGLAVRPFVQADSAGCFYDDVYTFFDAETGSAKIIDRDGRTQYEVADRSKDYSNIDRPNLISSSGDGVILLSWQKGTNSPSNYDSVSSSVIGIDQAGKELFSTSVGKGFRVSELGFFRDGRAFVGSVNINGNHKWGLLDTRGNWVAEITDATPDGWFANGMAHVKMTKDGAAAYMNRAGVVVYKE